MAIHETFVRGQAIKSSSDRSFGLVFAALFAIIGLSPLRHHMPIYSWALALAVVFLAFAALVPSALHPFNLAWTWVAIMLQRVTTPVVMSILFYLLITPMALLMRLFGKSPIRRCFDRQAATYWIKRNPAGPLPESLRNQF